MDKWTAGGIPSPYETTQTQAAFGFLEEASTALRVSRKRLDRLHARLSVLLTHGRATLQTAHDTQSRVPSADLWEGIREFAAEADGTLAGVAAQIEGATTAFSLAGSAADQPLGQLRSYGVPGAPQLPPTQRQRTSPSAGRSGTLDDITRRDDGRYRY